MERCPEGSRPLRTADPKEPWTCALTAERHRDARECPPGAHPVVGTDPYNPFHCALSDVRLVPARGACPPGQSAVPSADPGKEYECEGAMRAPACPKNTRPVPTPGRLTPFRCVAEPARARPPSGGRCPPGTRKVRTENPFAPLQCAPQARAGAAGYSDYAVRGQLRLRYPSSWALSDAWKESPPSLYILWIPPTDGPPAALTVSRHRRGATEYEPMEIAMEKEKRWRAARSEEGAPVAGLPALHLAVPGESKSAFVRAADGYFVLSYSAPGELFERWLPAYRTLLESFTVLDAGRGR